MKPVVSAFNAWSCVVISCFGVVILSVLGSLFNRNHFSVMGSTSDPTDNGPVALSLFIAVAIYIVFIAFCGYQGWLHIKASRKGAISLR